MSGHEEEQTVPQDLLWVHNVLRVHLALERAQPLDFLRAQDVLRLVGEIETAGVGTTAVLLRLLDG